MQNVFLLDSVEKISDIFLFLDSLNVHIISGFVGEDSEDSLLKILAWVDQKIFCSSGLK